MPLHSWPITLASCGDEKAFGEERKELLQPLSANAKMPRLLLASTKPEDQNMPLLWRQSGPSEDKNAWP